MEQIVPAQKWKGSLFWSVSTTDTVFNRGTSKPKYTKWAVAVTVLLPYKRSRVSKLWCCCWSLVAFQTCSLPGTQHSIVPLITLTSMQMLSKNLIKHFMRAHELMLRNISIGYAIAWENMMASTKKRRIPSSFYRLSILYLFLNFPNIKLIAYIYNRSMAYRADR